MYSLELISKLENFLEQYDKVILLTEPYFPINIGSAFVVSKKILIIAEKNMYWDENNIDFIKVSKEEAKEMIDLYHTYEFSDCFKVLSDSPHSFGGVLNLYRQGMLTDEEVLKIIFT